MDRMVCSGNSLKSSPRPAAIPTEAMTTPSPSTPALPPDSALESPLLRDAGFAHAFLTRRGGASTGPFSSLSFVQASGDTPEHVRENLRRVGAHLGVADSHIYYLSQVHGTETHVAHCSLDQEEFWSRKGDIVLTSDERAAAAIRTADCVPVLLACRKTGWVAACHSGWLGCVRGAAISAVRALEEQGANDLIAAIGPHISKTAFEVGPDVAQQLLDASPDQGIVDLSYEKPHVDLRKMVRAQLVQSGVSDALIDDVHGCTLLEPERFFSFRRDKNPSGRMLSLIVPRSR